MKQTTESDGKNAPITLAQQFDKNGIMSYYNVMFDIGSIFDSTLLGIALWRARAIPVWAALLQEGFEGALHSLTTYANRGTPMRIVSWNCNMGLEKKREALMRLRPDIAVLQECSEKDIARTEASFKHWVGTNTRKGLAVVGFANYTYTIDDSYTEEWPWFLPVRVEDVPLHILGLWACVRDQRLRYVRVMHHAVNHYERFLSAPHTVTIGDFNSNAIWDRRYREHSHSRLVEKLGQLGLISAYHTLRDEVQGREVTPTQFMYRHPSKPYHLDYAFVSQMLGSSCELLIGEPPEWLDKSDHMPLVLTLSISPRLP